MPQFDRVLGLGPDCRTKFQLNRLFGRENAVFGIFDRQRTTVDGIVAHFDSHFRGCFDVRDMRVIDGLVHNERMQSEHPHHFPRKTNMFEMCVHYPFTLARYLRRRASTVGALNRPGRLLLVISNVDEAGQAKISLAVRRYAPRLDFGLVSVHDSHLPPTRPRGAYRWEGNYPAWTEALGNYTIAGVAPMTELAGQQAETGQR